jgi:serine/threonine-protein kinase RsbW
VLSSQPSSSPLVCHDATQAPPLEALGCALESLAKLECWSEPTLFRARLILEEILQNIFDHGTGKGRVKVWVQTCPHRIELLIEGPGRGFDPREGPQFNPDDSLVQRTPGGIGLHLVRELCTVIEFAQLPDTHQLHLHLPRD